MSVKTLFKRSKSSDRVDGRHRGGEEAQHLGGEDGEAGAEEQSYRCGLQGSQ
jgi:hypothetical protein